MSVITTEMTREELQQLIDQAVWQALQRMFQDPDYGLALRDDVVERLKADESLDEDELLSAEQVASELDLDW